jgi:hypothetical protein
LRASRPFRFYDLPEKLTELRKAATLMVMVYYNNRKNKVKSAKVNGTERFQKKQEQNYSSHLAHRQCRLSPV